MLRCFVSLFLIPLLLWSGLPPCALAFTFAQARADWQPALVQAGASITAPTPVVCTIESPALRDWTLDCRRLGTGTSATYDADGRREFSYDRRGKATQTVYDALGRVGEMWFIGGAGDTAVRLSHADYDAAGRVWKSTDGSNHTTTYIYDNAGRRTAVRNANGELSQYAYDDAGNARFFSDARGQTVESVYDRVNRRVRTIFPVSAIVEGNTVRTIATEAVTELRRDCEICLV